MHISVLDVKSSQMQGRAGSIQAAINLELDDEDISSMEIIIESLNGQLPNLDLVNMVIRLCQSEGIPAALKTLVRLVEEICKIITSSYPL